MRHLIKAFTTTLATKVLLTTTVLADDHNSTKHFDGLYSGVELGLQNIYGGAFIDNLDILQRETKFIGSILLGWRHQLDSSLVFGLEGQLGLTDGDLTRNERNKSLNITYQNSSQLAAGLTIGYALGTKKDWLLYSYVFATRRDFDLSINIGNSHFTQEDRMGILRYGLGIEKQWQNGFGIKLTAGSNYTSFGDLTTNMDVNGKLEAAAGIVYQF